MFEGFFVLGCFWAVVHYGFKSAHDVPSTQYEVSFHEAERRRGVPYFYA